MTKSKKRFLTVLSIFLVVGIVSPLSAFAADGKGGVFTPTESYPYSETLLWDNDTVVVDINFDDEHMSTWFYRYQCSPDSIHFIARKAVTGGYSYKLYILSNTPVYTYVINTSNGYNGSGYYPSNEGSIGGYSYSTTWELNFVDNSKLIYRSNKMTSVPPSLSLGSGVVLVDHYIWTYPSMSYVQSNEQYSKISQEINDGFSMVDERLDSGFSNVNGAINQGFQDVTGAINNGVTEIIGAGSDMPTLDTNNDWMNDSLTKMNEWLDDMSEFENQLEENKGENAVNMANAGSFLSSFFDTVPVGLICAFTFVLVVIVVVKLIGR